MQHTGREIEQILNLLVVDLGEAGLDKIVAFALFDFAPQFLDGSRDDPFTFILLVDFPLEDLLLSRHGICLARSCLSIREYGCTVALNSGVD